MYEKWVRQKKVPPQSGTIKINTADLPEECAREFVSAVTKRIKSRVDKSNSQIKTLKRVLNMPDAKGLLVLCNSGNALLSPETVFWRLCQTLRGPHHSSIDWLIYMTHGLPVQLDGMPEPADLFAQPVRKGFEKMPVDLFRRIEDAWMKHMTKQGPVRVYEGVDPKRLVGAKHK